jgi:hypothetical protein
MMSTVVFASGRAWVRSAFPELMQESENGMVAYQASKFLLGTGAGIVPPSPSTAAVQVNIGAAVRLGHRLARAGRYWCGGSVGRACACCWPADRRHACVGGRGRWRSGGMTLDTLLLAAAVGLVIAAVIGLL